MVDAIETVTTDLSSHHIEGYATAAAGDPSGFFSTSLMSHVVGNLWTGGCRGGVRLPDDFAHVISLYPWEKYTLGPDTSRAEVKLYDHADVPLPGTLYSVAGYVLACVREGKTLVHCQAGLNRSGLIAGLALVLSGVTPAAAVALLRDRRSPAVLCNPAFYRWLMTQNEGPLL